MQKDNNHFYSLFSSKPCSDAEREGCRSRLIGNYFIGVLRKKNKTQYRYKEETSGEV